MALAPAAVSFDQARVGPGSITGPVMGLAVNRRQG